MLIARWFAVRSVSQSMGYGFPMKLELPDLLRPAKSVAVKLPSGRSFDLPHCYPTFPEWSESNSTYTFGGKQLLNYAGRPVFAELYVLRLLQDHGWDGVWVSSYRRRYLRDMPADSKLRNHVSLEPEREATLRKIAAKWGGCFDVFAWHGNEAIFCECKRQKRDRLRPSQLAWIDAALNAGATNLLVVEWEKAAS